MPSQFSTHDVFNQSPPFEDVNLFTTDQPLREAVAREGSSTANERLAPFGARCGSREAFELGRLANTFPPRLETYDPKGHRVDLVQFHPAYHALMEASCQHGVHCMASEHLAAGRQARPASGIHVERAASMYMAAQMESGHCCPITMTSAAVPTLLLQPDIADAWLPKVLVRAYDKRFLPAAEKTAVQIGMGMTEKQGGTDVRANTTTATPAGTGGPGREYLVTGHKWFMSAPMCDAFLVLAQAPGGLSCLLMPRFLPDGTVNAIHLQRLKDKLGNRSNASSEPEFHGAHAWLIGEEGRGVPAIIEMVTWTRLDCAVANAGLMRLALANALHHARHRQVFGRRLIEQPMMAHVLADMAVELEAATALVFRLARAFDRLDDPREAAWRRLMTPVTKYWVCKIAPPLVYEAMECMGGNGYVEEGPLARIYREVPVNAIWEGSGNVMALDVLRVLQREPNVAESVMAQLHQAVTGDRNLEASFARLHKYLGEPALLELRGRVVLEGLAVLAAATLLRAHAPAAVADAFIGTRIAGGPRQTYGQGLEKADLRAILARAGPAGQPC